MHFQGVIERREDSYLPPPPLKPGSQYNVNVTLRQEVIQFSMGLVIGIEMISIPATVAATNPLKIV